MSSLEIWKLIQDGYTEPSQEEEARMDNDGKE